MAIGGRDSPYRMVSCVEESSGEKALYRKVEIVCSNVFNTNQFWDWNWSAGSWFPANRNKFLEPWGIKQTLEIKMDIDGGQVIAPETDQVEGQFAQGPFQHAFGF